MIWPFKKKSILSQPEDRGWYKIFESYAGAYQQNVSVDRSAVLANHAIFTCCTLIASDISKLRLKLVKQVNGIWKEQKIESYGVIKKPNSWQNRIQFFENWILSKMSRGNTYILKQRDASGKVKAMYILCPDFVTPLVSESGQVFYRLGKDNLSGLLEQTVVPASEIIHDRFNCLFHPLVGLSPVYACGVSATKGLKIEENSTKFFDNMSRPSGILTAPGVISDETAERLKTAWQENFTGSNIGKVAVLGDDLKYVALSLSAEQSQLVEQLKLTAEIVCATYHVPKYKVIGDPPSYNNIEALDQGYYSQCLQNLIESIELLLDEGLDIPDGMGTEFDLDGLLRMDTATQIKSLSEEVKGGISTPNEARLARNKKPIEGGDTVYMQEQNYSLEALSRRDQKEDPFSSNNVKQENKNPEPDNAVPKGLILPYLSMEVRRIESPAAALAAS